MKRDDVISLGFTEINQAWFKIEIGYFYIELCIEDKGSRCFLYSNDSGDREAAPLLNLNIERLNKIIKFCKDYK